MTVCGPFVCHKGKIMNMKEVFEQGIVLGRLLEHHYDETKIDNTGTNLKMEVIYCTLPHRLSFCPFTNIISGVPRGNTK